MDNRKRNNNKQKSKQNPKVNTNTNTEVLNTKEEKEETDAQLATKEAPAEKNTENKEIENKTIEGQQESKKPDTNKTTEQQVDEGMTAASTESKEKPEKENRREETVQKEITRKETSSKENNQKAGTSKETSKAQTKSAADFSSEHAREMAMNAAKILLPVAACAIVIAVIISFVSSRRSQTVDLSLDTETGSDMSGAVTLSEEPLAKNAYTNVNELMRAFYTALADGDMDTVRALKDYNTDREIITYEKKSEFIESYENVNCYTKPGIEDNSYFVYATYDVKIKDIATEAPGLNAFYVYTADDGSLKIDGDTEENIKAAFKLVTSQDDVVDLYNKIDVSYNEATAADEALEQFMTDLPKVIKESVGVALAQLEIQNESEEPAETAESQPAETETPSENEEPLQNQVVNQIVRTTDTVNVRSSDSEEADKIGKAQAGTELKRIEERINGWSKVIFEDKEAYIKSDYLEVITAEAPEETVGTVTATTNVNVRSQASQDSERLGSAQTGSSYNLLEDQGEWYMIDYNGSIGFVKAEFFTR